MNVLRALSIIVQITQVLCVKTRLAGLDAFVKTASLRTGPRASVSSLAARQSAYKLYLYLADWVLLCSLEIIIILPDRAVEHIGPQRLLSSPFCL